MEPNSKLLKITSRLVLATLIILILVVGKSFLVPLTWSLLVGLASIKFIEKIEKKTRMPKDLVIFIFLFFLLLLLISIGYFFYIELSHIFKDLPSISQKISDRLHELSLALKDTGIHIPDHIDKIYISDWIHHHNIQIVNFISELGMNVWSVILVLFYLFFILHYQDLVPQFFKMKIKDPVKLKSMQNRFEKSMTLIRGYISGLLLLTLISAAMNYVVFLLFGLKFALFFAVFLAILNLIPYVGNPIGLLVIIFYAIITKDNMLIPVLIFAALFIMNFLQENVVRPLVVGDKMKINAFAVFISIIIGGMIWGISGMVLFIPIAGILKILLEEHKIHGAYAIFFSELQKKPKTAKK
ncbi:MAG: AI-2E family transporter [Candidatus Cloacimonadota bacterium]|nr:AI-2E family transporter [Candidatus Cloacimonadota bacterium]